VNALERSWYQRFGWSWLLLPLSGLFYLLSSLRRVAYRYRLLSSSRLPVPVIVIGNITVGSTGKTPLTLWLCQQLKQQGWQPGIISRGYGVKLAAPTLVQPAGNASDFGDEPLFLAQRSGCPVVIYPNRVLAGQYLLAQTACDVIICDDGLQHYALTRDLEIILLDAKRGLGNGLLLPAGPLREGSWRLRAADWVLANGGPVAQTQLFFTLKPALAESLSAPTVTLAAGSTVTLVSGIGNPQRFAETVRACGYQVTACHWFADHHPFQPADFANLAGPILMTEKDAVKCRPFARPDWYVLPVSAECPAEFEQQLLQRIAALRSADGI
jgi:tetraacyldisaccharide 4'-kinase